MSDYKEPSFGVDNFRKPLVYNNEEALLRCLLLVLFGKPGFYPSIPELGIHIQEYRHAKFEDIDLESLKSKLSYQCKALSDTITDGMLDITKEYLDSEKQQPIILIKMQVYKDNNEAKQLLLGLVSDGNNVNYNYKVYDAGL